ncbi:MAG: type I secretion system permease/ATPase, partial [Paracoccaceae bacterium]
MKQKSDSNKDVQQAKRSGFWLLAVVFLFSIFVNLLMLTGPLFMLQVYDRVLSSRSEETLTALFLLVGFLFALMGGLDYARGRVMARYGANIQALLDGRIFSAVIRRTLEPKFKGAPASGLRDMEAAQAVFGSTTLLALFDIPWTPLFVAAIFVFHPMLGWLAVAGGCILIAVALINNGLTRQKTGAAQQASQQAHGFADQTKHAAEIVRAQGMEAVAKERWLTLRETALSQKTTASDWTGLFAALTKSLRLFLQSAMLAVGAWLVLQNEMTAGAMIAGSILLGRALAPIEQVIGQWGLFQNGMRGWRSIRETLDAIPEEGHRVPLPEPEARLLVSGLTIFGPGTKAPILRNVGFALEPGLALGIIGRSGSGKSTLARSLMGLVPPSAGEIRLGGATLDQYPPEDLGRFVGYLPQNVTLFSGTIAENIARLELEPDPKRIVEAARRANAHEMILALPDGYQTVIHGQDNLLSGGQRQRIALARAFYSDPVLLVLDEPNSALDSEGSDALNRAIREFKAAEKSVLIMTHRPMAISECDRLIVLDQG